MFDESFGARFEIVVAKAPPDPTLVKISQNQLPLQRPSRSVHITKMDIVDRLQWQDVYEQSSQSLRHCCRSTRVHSRHSAHQVIIFKIDLVTINVGIEALSDVIKTSVRLAYWIKCKIVI